VTRRNGKARKEEAPPTPPAPAATEQPPSVTVADGRDSKSGRFTAGNKFSRGNQHWRRRCELMRAVHKAIGEREIKRLFRAMLDCATQERDWEAAKLLLSFAIGAPPEGSPDPDAEDLDELQRLAARPPLRGPAGVLGILAGRPPALVIAALEQADRNRAEEFPDNPLAQLLGEDLRTPGEEDGNGEQEHDE
jgi:hypothetical protein